MVDPEIIGNVQGVYVCVCMSAHLLELIASFWFLNNCEQAPNKRSEKSQSERIILDQVAHTYHQRDKKN